LGFVPPRLSEYPQPRPVLNLLQPLIIKTSDPLQLGSAGLAARVHGYLKLTAL